MRTLFNHYNQTKKTGLEPTFESLASRGPSLNRAEFSRCIRDIGLQGPLLSRSEVEAIARGLVTGHGSVLLDEAGFLEGVCRCCCAMMRHTSFREAPDAEKVAAVLRRASLGSLPELNSRLRLLADSSLGMAATLTRPLAVADFAAHDGDGKSEGPRNGKSEGPHNGPPAKDPHPFMWESKVGTLNGGAPHDGLALGLGPGGTTAEDVWTEPFQGPVKGHQPFQRAQGARYMVPVGARLENPR